MGNLYTNMKVFRFKEKLDSLSLNEDRIMSPIHIRIKPTNVCSHNCRYCAYRSDKLQLGKDMRLADYIPKEKMMEIIEDIIDMGVKAVTFSGGGDPFNYPYLLETVKKLADSPVKFASLTNGSKLHGEISEIMSNRATWLRISIDGWDDDSYSYYRTVPKGEFEKVMKNLENFKKRGGDCYLGVSLIVDKHNVSHMYELMKRLKDIGVDSTKVSACIVSNDSEENNRYHQPIKGLFKEQVQRATEHLADNKFEIYDSYHGLDGKFGKEYTWCPYLQILPVIGADLNVYSCQDKAYNFDEGVLGSIKQESFKDFWYKDKTKFFRINPSVICNHHCVANDKNKLIVDYLNADIRHLGFV